MELCWVDMPVGVGGEGGISSFCLIPALTKVSVLPNNISGMLGVFFFCLSPHHSLLVFHYSAS